MELGISYGNILLVDNEYLQAKDLQRLRAALFVGRSVIDNAIEEMYLKYRFTAPNVQRGSIWVMRLATDIRRVITPVGRAINDHKQSNRGVFSDGSHVMEGFQPHWQVIEENGYIPEIRELPAPPRAQRYMKGANLLVRDTPLID